MQIKTKYNIGDKVFFMLENRIVEAPIHSIEARIEKKEIQYSYTVSFLTSDGTCESIRLNENQMYKTTSQLFKDLRDNIILAKEPCLNDKI